MPRHIAGWVVIAALALLGIDSTEAADRSHDLELAGQAVRSFMSHVYQNDLEGARRWVASPEGLESFIGREVLSDEERGRIAEEVAEIDLRPVSGYERYEDPDTPPMSVGSPMRFVTSFRGTPMVISAIKSSEGWRVDLRWWLAMADIMRGKEILEGAPEYVIKTFLFALIREDRAQLGALVASGFDVEGLYPPDYHDPRLDHFYMLVAEMPVVAMGDADMINTESKGLVRVADLAKGDRIFVGLFGAVEAMFRLRREGDEWKIVPMDYIRRLEIW
jgi:hypothetical protein